MKIDAIPVLGRLKRTLNSLALNFIFLSLTSLVLGLIILFYPAVLQILVVALLFVMAVIFLAIAIHISSYRRKYFDWMEKK